MGGGGGRWKVGGWRQASTVVVVMVRGSDELAVFVGGLYCPPGIPRSVHMDSAQTARTVHGIFLAGHPANFKFLVLVQSVDSPSKVLVKSQ
jgi:hypothetical protein